MNTSARTNLFIFLAISIISCVAAIFAFKNPLAVLETTDTAVTSISIIFSLSIALTTMAVRAPQIDPNIVFKQEDRLAMRKDIKQDNKRTMFRQTLLIITSLLAVTTGVLFIALSSYAPHSFCQKIIASAFSFTATMSLLFSFYLPITISQIITRDAELSR